MRLLPLLLVLSSSLSLGARSASAEPPRLASIEPAARGDAAPVDEGAQANRPAHSPEAGLRGVSFGVGTSIVVPGGKYASGVGMGDFGPGMGVSFMLGAYVSRHLGLVAGVRASHQHQGFSNCSGETDEGKCGGLSYQFPVMVQFAFRDRKDGLYLQSGLALASTYMAHGNATVLTASSPFDYKFGVGYRHTEALAPRRFGIDGYLNVDVGRFSEISLDRVGPDLKGQIDRKAIHAAVELGVSMLWSL